MRILYITTVGMTMRFFQSFISELKKKGNVVDIACSDTESVPDYYKKERFRVFRLSCSRSPFDVGNIRAIREIRMIVKENRYNIVHCHTPIAAACTRLACRPLRKQMELRVIYTAHGFHFCKGASKKNWVAYYPVEKWLSRYTDDLITITREDYLRAKRKFSAENTYYIPGVGIKTEVFAVNHNGDRIRKELGIDSDRIMLLSVGELNENKNHEIVIRAIKGLPNELVYVVAGEGDKREYLGKLIKSLSLQERVRLVGFRNDVVDFYDAADIYILPSRREGLNVSLMEAMASGLPVLCGKIRGNTDLIDGRGGILFNPDDVNEVRGAIRNMLVEKNNYGMGMHNSIKSKCYDESVVNVMYYRVYQNG